MAGRLRVLKARAGRIVRGRFVPNPKGKRSNIAAGFHDEEGQFHPIRASFDYDPGRAGESRRKKAKAKKKKAPKPPRKKAKRAPKKKAKARKRRK